MEGCQLLNNNEEEEYLGGSEIMSHNRDNFDSHYSEKEIEPILVIEETIERLIRSGLDPVKAYLVTQSLKYVLRAGTKDGEDVNKDLFKAFNYMHKATRGEWASGQ